jgi:hypothetical protein
MFGPRYLVPAALLLASVSGCAGARLVRETSSGGVVAIPAKTNSWPTYYEDSARKLMAQKCPNGYTIVSAEEVVVGQKTINRNTSDTNVTDMTGQKRWPPSTQTSATNTNVQETVNQTEYRITFQAKDPPAR